MIRRDDNGEEYQEFRVSSSYILRYVGFFVAMVAGGIFGLFWAKEHGNDFILRLSAGLIVYCWAPLIPLRTVRTRWRLYGDRIEELRGKKSTSIQFEEAVLVDGFDGEHSKYIDIRGDNGRILLGPKIGAFRELRTAIIALGFPTSTADEHERSRSYLGEENLEFVHSPLIRWSGPAVTLLFGSWMVVSIFVFWGASIVFQISMSGFFLAATCLGLAVTYTTFPRVFVTRDHIEHVAPWGRRMLRCGPGTKGRWIRKLASDAVELTDGQQTILIFESTKDFYPQLEALKTRVDWQELSSDEPLETSLGFFIRSLCYVGPVMFFASFAWGIWYGISSNGVSQIAMILLFSGMIVYMGWELYKSGRATIVHARFTPEEIEVQSFLRSRTYSSAELTRVYTEGTNNHGQEVVAVLLEFGDDSYKVLPFASVGGTRLYRTLAERYPDAVGHLDQTN